MEETITGICLTCKRALRESDLTVKSMPFTAFPGQYTVKDCPCLHEYGRGYEAFLTCEGCGQQYLESAIHGNGLCCDCDKEAG